MKTAPVNGVGKGIGAAVRGGLPRPAQRDEQ